MDQKPLSPTATSPHAQQQQQQQQQQGGVYNPVRPEQVFGQQAGQFQNPPPPSQGFGQQQQQQQPHQQQQGYGGGQQQPQQQQPQQQQGGGYGAQQPQQQPQQNNAGGGYPYGGGYGAPQQHQQHAPAPGVYQQQQTGGYGYAPPRSGYDLPIAPPPPGVDPISDQHEQQRLAELFRRQQQLAHLPPQQRIVAVRDAAKELGFNTTAPVAAPPIVQQIGGPSRPYAASAGSSSYQGAGDYDQYARLHQAREAAASRAASDFMRAGVDSQDALYRRAGGASDYGGYGAGAPSAGRRGYEASSSAYDRRDAYGTSAAGRDNYPASSGYGRDNTNAPVNRATTAEYGAGARGEGRDVGRTWA